MNKNVSIKIRYFSVLLAKVMVEIEYKIFVRKLKKHDLMADVDDQRFHHFSP